MYRERFDAACDPPRVDRSPHWRERILCVLLLFEMLFGCDARDNGTPDVYKILGGARIRQVDKDYSHMNNEKINENQEDLYIGNSGNPWNASSTRIYDKDIYVYSSSNNVTANNMKSQFASHLQYHFQPKKLHFRKSDIFDFVVDWYTTVFWCVDYK
ncbi:PREDICTED: uncharacterized protein LOC108751197 [Trachymyrmex septentrionalis]|uniref:uncharacterized protein LOC108751197 n=1 Tax=Trachymyrmex septentrionalis TaxID=34720 RepID=UPI00084F1D6E|nr:PREDICTED: uncharacterized protein LOC108751197 [Trachymyrmex septentrionalis]